jgi:hypothetical protein
VKSGGVQPSTDGCFPLHFDSDAAVDGRRVTALTYLNPEWKPGDGGELVLYPFPVGGVTGLVFLLPLSLSPTVTLGTCREPSGRCFDSIINLTVC